MSRAEEPRRHADRAAQFMPFAALTGYYDLVLPFYPVFSLRFLRPAV